MSIRGTSRFHTMPFSVNGTTDGPSQDFSSSSSSSLEETTAVKLQKLAEEIDLKVGQFGAPLKPYLPGIGRFLIVATFLEDAFRIITQWSDQVHYIWNYRKYPYFLTVPFLAINVLLMLAGSYSVISRRKLEFGVGALLGVVITQALVYGLVSNAQFFFRNLSVIGGLLMVVSDAFVRDRRGLSLPGLPMVEDKDKSKYFQLAGRILLLVMFLSSILSGTWSTFGIVTYFIGLIACGCVVVGFRARLNALIMAVLLTVQNLFINNYWSYATGHPSRDFLRYEHFQTLSIIGGLLLVVNTGAGKISIDEKKKIY